MKLCALSIDLDEIRQYHAIHGLPARAGGSAHAVFDLALPRFRELAKEHALPYTLFTVASDLTRAQNAEVLASLSREGHEIANHSLDHLYDLTRRSPEEIWRQVEQANEAIERAVGERPVGFRAPGYTTNRALYDALERCGMRYSSSVFPCPPYYLAKLLAVWSHAVRGRTSSSVIDTPHVLRAPRAPYRVGEPYWRRGAGVLELPIQVTPLLRLPFIGTSLTLAGPALARRLARSLVGEPLVNIELHGIDLLDGGDGLADLAAQQFDLRTPVTKKWESLAAVIETFRAHGYAFVTLRDAAAHFS